MMYFDFFRRFRAFFLLCLLACAAAYYGRHYLSSPPWLGARATGGGGEPNCKRDVDCANLVAELVLVHPNVATDCSANAACGGGDNFKQLFYKVRLKYKTSNSLDDHDFYLDYDALSVKVDLIVSGTAPLYSQIDTPVTRSCYLTGPGMTWGDTTGGNANVATFEAGPYSAAIDFQDYSIDSCGGDKIHFTPDTCTGYYCGFADLFTVAVDAYPGETVQLIITDAFYDPGVGEVCDLPHNYPAAVSVDTLDAPVSAPNRNLLVRLADPVTAANGLGGCDIDVEVVNSGAPDIFVSYLEFVVKISPDAAMPPFKITSYYDDPPIQVGNDYYVRFRQPYGFTISGSDTVKLGRITLDPPITKNQPWSAAVALVDAAHSRLKASFAADTTDYCSTLRLDTDVDTCSGSGAPCDYDVAFKIWPPENVSSDCPSNKKVKVGLTSATLSKIYLWRLAFALKFDLSDGAAITDMHTSSLCSTTVAAGCYDFMGSTETDCWKPESDGVFKFCFDVSGESDPVTLDFSGDGAFLEIEFNSVGCINGVSLLSLDMVPDTPYQYCPPLPDSIPNPFILCEPQIFGKLATETNAGLSNAQVTLKQIENNSPCDSTNCPPVIDTTAGPGTYTFCPCTVCAKFEVTPYKNDNPVNGVSTFDLVLINKHILGLEPLNSPYKIIAADANDSRSITTFDIVEFRKLILGIYTKLPANTSWRFVDKDYDFPNSANPFQEIFPERDTLDLSSSPTQEANFVAIKVGDVNGNAVPMVVPNPVATLAVPAKGAISAGQVITLPVTYTGAEALEAFQLGIRFDPKTLTLIGPSQGDLPGYNAGNFGLTNAAQGEIRTLWFADPTVPGEVLHPGDVLFYLSFQAKKPLPVSAALLDLDDALLTNSAWKPNGREFSLRRGQALEERATEMPETTAPLQAECRPNPTSGEAQLSVRSDRAGRARIAVFGPFGQRQWMQEVPLTTGEQTFDIPAMAQLPAGVYFWKVLTPWAKAQGHLIKQ